MNKQELRAIMLIVNKLGWNDMSADKAIRNIDKMVKYIQWKDSEMYDIWDDYEDTLLSIARWRQESLCNIFHDAVMQEVYEMCEFLGHYNIVSTVMFYDTIWNELESIEEDMAWESVIDSQRYW